MQKYKPYSHHIKFPLFERFDRKREAYVYVQGENKSTSQKKKVLFETWTYVK